MEFPKILDTIGNTPIVHLSKTFEFNQPAILAKLEFFAPGGSVKDRLALAMVEDAEQRGILKTGGTIVECSSGNSGIGLAMVAAVKGYRAIIVMADKNSKEKQDIIKAFGAEVVLTPHEVLPEHPDSNYSTTERLSKEIEGAVHLDQFNNPANTEVHYSATAKEIWEQTEGEIEFIYAGIGTGGTLSGIAKYLKEKNPEIKAFGVDIEGSVFSDLFYKGTMSEPKQYKIEGIGGDNAPDNTRFEYYDELIMVSDRESFRAVNNLCRAEGIFAGGSSGSAVAAISKS
ncbi:MAG: cysteine synthase family protein, partial [candidate division Zixibacteria bacterium]|nr:cysteine synthase family protein [candidate division Zixibacteria bacterium]